MHFAINFPLMVEKKLRKTETTMVMMLIGSEGRTDGVDRQLHTPFSFPFSQTVDSNLS